MKYISWLLIVLMICGLVVGCSGMPTPTSNEPESTLEEATQTIEPEQLSLEQQVEIIQHCQSIALVAIEDSNCATGYHEISELLSTSSNLHYFIYATVDTLFYSVWQTYDRADEKRADAFAASLGDNCIVEDYSAKIPESNIEAILSELFGEETVSGLNWDDVFEDGYFLYEEGDPGSWMDLSISSTTDWDSTEKLDFSYCYEYTDEFSEDMIGQIQFSIKPDASSKYGRIIAGFEFSDSPNTSNNNPDVTPSDIEGSWVYWGALYGWEDEAYLTSPIPEDELDIDGQGEPSIMVSEQEDGTYLFNIYGKHITFRYSSTYDSYSVTDETLAEEYGYYNLVDNDTLHLVEREDIYVYKKSETSFSEDIYSWMESVPYMTIQEFVDAFNASSGTNYTQGNLLQQSNTFLQVARLRISAGQGPFDTGYYDVTEQYQIMDALDFDLDDVTGCYTIWETPAGTPGPNYACNKALWTDQEGNVKYITFHAPTTFSARMASTEYQMMLLELEPYLNIIDAHAERFALEQVSVPVFDLSTAGQFPVNTEVFVSYLYYGPAHMGDLIFIIQLPEMRQEY